MGDVRSHRGGVGHVDLASVEQVADGEQLQPRVALAPRPVVGAGVSGLLAHRARGLLHRQHDAYGGMLPVQHASQVADVGHRDVPGLH